jgi:hypothetical protein
MTDVTERKQTEEALEQVSRKLNDAKHEVDCIVEERTSELKRSSEGSPVRRHLERIFAAALRGRDLVKQILTFSRQTEHKKQPLKLVPVVREAPGLLRASLPSTIDNPHEPGGHFWICPRRSSPDSADRHEPLHQRRPRREASGRNHYG